MADFTFHHGGVSVPSLDEAVDWYGSVLGFEIESGSISMQRGRRYCLNGRQACG